jgi:hypothetical protein
MLHLGRSEPWLKANIRAQREFDLHRPKYKRAMDKKCVKAKEATYSSTPICA